MNSKFGCQRNQWELHGLINGNDVFTADLSEFDCNIKGKVVLFAQILYNDTTLIQ